MKKQSLKLFSLFLAACMLFAVLPPAARAETVKTGDVIVFGGYPQTLVTDSAVLDALNKLEKRWNTYRYYDNKTNQLDGNMKPGDWMRYADVTCDGEKYRAVTFDYYRPTSTQSWAANPIKPEHSSYQDENGYAPGNVYYFKYESLKWRVLDAASGLVFCESGIDAQAFHNTVFYNKDDSKYYHNASSDINISSYEFSSVRQWLQNDFYNTAFSPEEQALIGSTALEGETMRDKIFLLSAEEAGNDAYGFYNQTRQVVGTDYAKCQGLHDYENGYISWWLRTPGQTTSGASSVSQNGFVYTTPCNAWLIYLGILPAFRFASGVEESVNPKGGNGVIAPVTGDPDGDGTVTASDARLALRRAVDLETYAASSAEFVSCDIDGDGTVTASDARIILRIAVDLETADKYIKP
ncbi:MAG: dockerin type I repeat-containing protein [Clostridia bacterium]|nr:dockerin type I repeat-containing protein [Clostridia bacterium]MBQ9505792.1 dockerin type I repeat-containing protein [Clostridia bacterium]MBR5423176.1 dockerin type I repeat-containing protein [Clostridia bacterium]